MSPFPWCNAVSRLSRSGACRSLPSPTRGTSWIYGRPYSRGTLVLNTGVIVQAFYPLQSAVRGPVQAIAGMGRQSWN